MLSSKDVKSLFKSLPFLISFLIIQSLKPKEMGVAGAWSFLQYKSIEPTKSNDTQHYIGEHSYKMIHVDMVGAFYDSIRRCFLNCHEHEESKKITAANRVLAEINRVVNKRRCILYIDGIPTLERDYGHSKRLEKLLGIQEQLEKEVSKYVKNHTKLRHKTIMYLARQLFRVSPDIENVVYETAVKSGWNVVFAEGEAEVAIAKTGGIVLTRDSDMLFYPKIDTVICPFDGAYRFYNKKIMLPKLDLSSESFTVLGILAKNDYDEDFYAGEKNETDRDFHRNRMVQIYNEMINIKEDNFNVGNISGSSLIQTMLKSYISVMNAKTGKNITVEAYENSYSIFALQQEQPLLNGYDPRTYDINQPAYYLDKIHSYPRFRYN